MASTPLVHVTPNIVMNSQMLEAAYFAKAKKFVWLSSNAAYPPSGDRPVKEEELLDGDPYETYFGVAWMKRYTEILCRMYSEKLKNPMTTVVIRPSNIYGPGDIPLDIWGGRSVGFFRRLSQDEEITVPNDGKALLQPGFVEDLGGAFSLPLEQEDAIGQIFNISSERCVTLDAYLDIMMNIMGSNSSVDHMLMDELIETYPQYLGKWPAGLRFICEHMCIDISKAKSRLGYAPEVSLEVGMGLILDWMRNEGLVSF